MLSQREVSLNVSKPMQMMWFLVINRVRQWTELQGGQGGAVNLGGSSGPTDNPTSKKIQFLYHSDHSE